MKQSDSHIEQTDKQTFIFMKQTEKHMKPTDKPSQEDNQRSIFNRQTNRLAYGTIKHKSMHNITDR